MKKDISRECVEIFWISFSSWLLLSAPKPIKNLSDVALGALLSTVPCTRTTGMRRDVSTLARESSRVKFSGKRGLVGGLFACLPSAHPPVQATRELVFYTATSENDFGKQPAVYLRCLGRERVLEEEEAPHRGNSQTWWELLHSLQGPHPLGKARVRVVSNFLRRRILQTRRDPRRRQRSKRVRPDPLLHLQR